MLVYFLYHRITIDKHLNSKETKLFLVS